MIPVQKYFHQIDIYKTNIFLLLLAFYFFTGYGRLKNPDYRIFIALLEETRLNNSEENKVCYINTWLTSEGISGEFIQIPSECYYF